MEIGADHEIPGGVCVNCGKTVDWAFSIGSDAVPEPGDITVCGLCGHIMAFSEDLTLRELSDEEIVDVAGDERLVMIQKARAMMERK